MGGRACLCACSAALLRAQGNARRGCCTHTDRRTGTAGLGALDLCSSAARQRVPRCAVVTLVAPVRGLKVRPYPSERLPSVSRADGGNEGRAAKRVGGILIVDMLMGCCTVGNALCPWGLGALSSDVGWLSCWSVLAGRPRWGVCSILVGTGCTLMDVWPMSSHAPNTC